LQALVLKLQLRDGELPERERERERTREKERKRERESERERLTCKQALVLKLQLRDGELRLVAPQVSVFVLVKQVD